MATGGITQEKIIKIKRNPWADNFFRPLLITIMIMCINISLVNMVRLVNPTWRGIYFLLGMFITTVEAIYSYRVLKHYKSRGISVFRYRLAEATVLVLILKLLSFMDKSLAYISAHLQTVWQTPTAFFDLEFYMLLTLALIAWLAATNTIADWDALYDPYSDNTGPLDNLAARFFWGGGILLVISGVTQWVALEGVSSLVNWQRPSSGGIIFNVLIYFVLGLVLLSQVNLTTLLVRWRIQKITVAPGLVKQWAKYGVVFLGLVALVAFLLPTRYTLGFLATAAVVVNFLINIFVFIFQLLLFLITLPFSWLLSFLDATPQEPRAIPRATPPPLLDPPAGAATPWLDILRSLIFWLATLAIIGFMVKSYLDDHPELIAQLKRLKPIGLLLNLLWQVWQQLKKWTNAGLEKLPKRLGKIAAPGPGAAAIAQPWRWLWLKNLSPREQILGYYLNILNRAGKEGFRRQEHQTPFEYEPNLSQSMPAVQSEIQDVTHIFVRARYSTAEFNQEQAQQVKEEWQQIRKALRQGKRKKGD